MSDNRIPKKQAAPKQAAKLTAPPKSAAAKKAESKKPAASPKPSSGKGSSKGSGESKGETPKIDINALSFVQWVQVLGHVAGRMDREPKFCAEIAKGAFSADGKVAKTKNKKPKLPNAPTKAMNNYFIWKALASGGKNLVSTELKAAWAEAKERKTADYVEADNLAKEMAEEFKQVEAAFEKLYSSKEATEATKAQYMKMLSDWNERRNSVGAEEEESEETDETEETEEGTESQADEDGESEVKSQGTKRKREADDGSEPAAKRAKPEESTRPSTPKPGNKGSKRASEPALAVSGSQEF